MDLAYEHLWAAGYDLPPETSKVLSGMPFGPWRPAGPLLPVEAKSPRRGKKAAKAKRRVKS